MNKFIKCILLFVLMFIIIIITNSCSSTRLGFNDGKTDDHHWNSDPTRPDIRKQAEKNKREKLQRMGPIH